MPAPPTSNRLGNEKSPYLLQHASNPVDWYPWGEEAFARARADDKPIFLSIGYSTCHWCHVMAAESFEDENIATMLNEFFVAIKVDREERPDIDRIYMTSLQAMGQNGGWPMSMFLTPDLKPFYGGTYFHPETRYGRVGFRDLLRRVVEVWTKEREKVLESAETLTSFLRDAAQLSGKQGELTEGVLELCHRQLSSTYDATMGGFGSGPKFPRPVVFEFLLQYFQRAGTGSALEMTERTLQKMALGGMYDQIGGGFHRYSVDAEWRVPHFEKMLYDQAQLVNAYVSAFQVTGNSFYAGVAREVCDYVLRDLGTSDGGFASAEDADSARPEDPSEHGEGAFYVWTKKELLAALGQEGEVFCHYYGVADDGNAPFDPQQEFTGRNILYVAHPVADTARAFGRSEESVRASLILSKTTLQRLRERRPRPHLDDKVLAGWNGLMIGALARAGAVLDKPDYIKAAGSVAENIDNVLYDHETGMLRRRLRSGEARFEAHLDDYAFLASGLLDLYQSSFNIRWLAWAIRLAEQAVETFADRENGGFFDTSGRDPSVLVRLKDRYDGAEPTGNSAMVVNLLRLGHMTGRGEWISIAERTLVAFSGILSKQPVVMPAMAAALDLFLRPPLQIIIAGNTRELQVVEMLREVRRRYLPGAIVLVVEGKDGRATDQTLIPSMKDFTRIDGRPAAYVCRNFTCQLPVSRASSLAEQLDEFARNRENRSAGEPPPALG